MVMKDLSISVAFLHPDLGLGGAERLVVDAALELVGQGAQVEVLTAFHDPQRSFRETNDGSFPVFVCGGWFPRTIFGKAHAFCAYVRCILIALSIAWRAFRRKRQYDVVFADQVSAAVPFLRAFTSSKVLFYCHHPDLLLALRRPGLHRLYRKPLDWLEEVTTGQADKILVNSLYTAGIFAATFRKLSSRGMQPQVLYPACHVPSDGELGATGRSWPELLPPDLVTFLEAGPVFLSINRFERKKSIELAILALQQVLENQKGKQEPERRCRMVIAGGYDSRLAENREYLQELKALARNVGLAGQIWFLPSFTDQQRAALLAACIALVYTPSNEHFGIVPLEAMAAGRPVIACNNGGPVESVVHKETGFLCEPQPEEFAHAMRSLLGNDTLAAKCGENARRHVIQRFSRGAFGQRLWLEIKDMLQASQKAAPASSAKNK